jgi:hypothetical protein
MAHVGQSELPQHSQIPTDSHEIDRRVRPLQSVGDFEDGDRTRTPLENGENRFPGFCEFPSVSAEAVENRFGHRHNHTCEHICK